MDDTWKEASEIEEMHQMEININVSRRIIARLLHRHELDGFQTYIPKLFRFPQPEKRNCVGGGGRGKISSQMVIVYL